MMSRFAEPRIQADDLRAKGLGLALWCLVCAGLAGACADEQTPAGAEAESTAGVNAQADNRGGTPGGGAAGSTGGAAGDMSATGAVSEAGGTMSASGGAMSMQAPTTSGGMGAAQGGATDAGLGGGQPPGSDGSAEGGRGSVETADLDGGSTAAGPGTDGTDGGSDGELVGWASVSECGPNGTTGGGEGEPAVTVTSGGELESALESAGPLVIAVSGTIASPGGLSGIEDKTLIGIDDAEITGRFGLSASRNVIIKNIRFRDGDDDTFEASGVECVWFDHCEFLDGLDGNLDIVRGSNYVTVSWSRFYYTRGHDHMFSNLCGNGQPREDDVGKINLTFHHNWWGAGVNSRAPRVRYGQVHVFNNYYRYEPVPDDGGQDYAVGAGFESKLRVENNYFDGTSDPIIWISDEGTGEVVESGNEFVDTSGDVVTRGTSFTPPYAYAMDPGSEVKSLVMAGAGRQ